MKGELQMLIVELILFVVLLVILFVILVMYNSKLKKEFLKDMSVVLGLTEYETTQKFEELLRMAEECCTEECHKTKAAPAKIIVFAFSFSRESLNANSTLPGKILISPTWIKKLLDADPQWRVAFLETIGHELAHKMNEPNPIYWFSKKARLTNWARECRADFYGVEFACKYLPSETRATVIQAMKKKYPASRRSECTHPSWTTRYKLLERHTHLEQAVFEKLRRMIRFRDKEYSQNLAQKAMNYSL